MWCSGSVSMLEVMLNLVLHRCEFWKMQFAVQYFELALLRFRLFPSRHTGFCLCMCTSQIEWKQDNPWGGARLALPVPPKGHSGAFISNSR